jgi:3-methyladenine DNA glycosylase Tag
MEARHRMMKFETILGQALDRAGGAARLESLLPVPASPEELRARPDDRYLSQMSLRIFRAGLKHSLVDAKWPAFEDAFRGFEPRRVVAMSPEEIEALMGGKRLIRHWGKLKSVPANAAAMLAVSRERGGFGAYLADWPATDIVGLWADLEKRFSQMGGNSGPSFLRMVGKDTFLLTDDVQRMLVAAGAIDRPARSKRDRMAAQKAFNAWAGESGRPLCQLSRILALAAG